MKIDTSQNLEVRQSLSGRIADVTGRRYGHLEVLGLEVGGGRHPQWMCRCDCGGVLKTRGFQLKSGRATSCGCSRHVDMTGQKRGMLTYIRMTVERDKDGRCLWEVRCDCGEVRFLPPNTRSNSCGCNSIRLARSRMKTHGHTCRNGKQSPEYVSWRSMKSRCGSSSPKKKRYYKDRGIIVCKRWVNSFENFLLDLGPRPSGTTLDRIDSNKGYYPENCRWATSNEQDKNKRLENANAIAEMVEGLPSKDSMWIADAIRKMTKGSVHKNIFKNINRGKGESTWEQEAFSLRKMGTIAR